MKCDWLHPELYRTLADMQTVVITNPSTGQGTGIYGGGQYTATVPFALASVVGSMRVCADLETGEQYVMAEGSLRTGRRYPEQPDFGSPPEYIFDYDYWSYANTGWPILAALPGSQFNGVTDAGPAHEFGGRELPIVGGLDPDEKLPPLMSYNKDAGLDYPPFELTPPRFGEGPAVGGAGPGWFEERGPEPPIEQLAQANSGWNLKAVSQRCWVLLLIDPSAHGFYRYQGTGLPPEIDGVPTVIHPQMRIDFGLIWRLGPGSGLPGEYEATQGGGATPTTVTVPDEDDGGSSSPGAVWTQQEIAALAGEHGAPDPQLASAVAMAESGGREDATNVNADGSEDVGLWQINSVHGYPRESLLEAEFNVEAAREVSSNWTDWTPWVSFNSGAYLDFYG